MKIISLYLYSGIFLPLKLRTANNPCRDYLCLLAHGLAARCTYPPYTDILNIPPKH